jgi:hypothetical protein
VLISATYAAVPIEKMVWGGGEEIVSIVADVYRWSSSPNREAESTDAPLGAHCLVVMKVALVVAFIVLSVPMVICQSVG